MDHRPTILSIHTRVLNWWGGDEWTLRHIAEYLVSEVWNLGETLSVGRILLILGFSIVALDGFIWGLSTVAGSWSLAGVFFNRAVSSCVVTFLAALLLFFLFDRAPLEDLRVTFTRTILVGFRRLSPPLPWTSHRTKPYHLG